MGRIVGQGAELLYGLRAYAERAVLRGRPPPPSVYRGAKAPIRDAARASLGQPTSIAAADANSQSLARSVANAVKSITGDAFSSVFVSVRQPAMVDTALTAHFREMMRSMQKTKPVDLRNGMAFKQAKRPKMFMPSPPSFEGGSNTANVGLNPYKRAFSAYSMFSDHLVTHAPLALRAASDELEDEWQKYYRKRANAARRVGMRTSTRRSGYLMDRFAVHKMIPVTEIPVEVKKVIKALKAESQASEPVASASVTKEPSASSLETSVYDAFTFPSSLDEPSVTTRLLIPLCPDLELLLAPQSNASDLDPLSRSAFLQDVTQVVDSFHHHRLKRIVTIERAFDQEPLRAYRPKEWDENMLLELYEGTQSVRQVCLTIDFPHLTVAEVEQMLAQAMSHESARWYAGFLYEVYRDGLQSGETESWTGVDSPPSSSMMTDVAGDIDDMGAASLVSMADQRNSPPRSAVLSSELHFPTLDMRSTVRSPRHSSSMS